MKPSNPTHGSPLTRGSILDRAMAIVDHDGLEALTMRRLGRELEVEAMSIYHHIANKGALLEALVIDLLDSVEDDLTGDAAEMLEQFARSIRATLGRHPNLAALVAERLPTTFFDAPAATTCTRQLVEAGFDQEAARWILDAFIGFVVGHTLVDLVDGRHGNASDEAAFETGLRFLLAGLREELGL